METQKKKKKKIWITVIIAAFVIIIAIAVVLIKKFTAEIEITANTIEVEPVQTRDLSDYISLTGSISGESRTNVVSEATAKVLTVDVQVGDTVKVGDILVTLDKNELEKQIEQLQKQISNADALAKNEAAQRNKSLTEAKEDQNTALSRAQQVISEAQQTVDHLQNQIAVLEQNIAVKKEEYNNAAEEEMIASLREEITVLEEQKNGYEQSLNSAKGSLSAAQENYNDVVVSTERNISAAQNVIEMAKYQTDGTEELSSQLETLKKQLEECTLVAPCSGVITAVNISVGDQYVAGQTMITIEDTSNLIVAVEVDETEILKLQEGMKAEIKTMASGEEEIEGTVTRVVRVKNQSVNPNSMEGGSGNGYTAEITMKNDNLLIGMKATAKIILNEKKGILAVPYDLVRYDENEHAYVLVAEAGQEGMATAVRKNITVGEEIDYYVEVTQGELAEGDMLIYDYSGTIREGDSFQPQQLYEEQMIESETDMEETYE